MAEAEAPYCGGVVAADAALLGVEAHALADDGGFRAGLAPDGEGHLEAYDEAAAGFGELGGTGAERVFMVEFVAADGALEVRRDVPAHVEALHDGWMFEWLVAEVRRLWDWCGDR